MKRSLLLALGLLLSTCAACDKTSKVVPDSPSSPTQAPPQVQKVTTPMPTETKSLAKSSNAFAFDLYATVRTAPGNLAVSPASITAALAMTFGGARGTTEAQMKQALHFEGAQDAVMNDWGSLSRALQDPGRPLVLRIANRLFGEKTTTFEKGYLEKTKAAYGAPLEAVDFKHAFEPARARINGWVEEQTEKRIKDLLPASSLDAETRLVLVNAIYFLADWAEPFEKTATFDAAFTVAPGTEKKTPTMHRADQLRLAEVDGLKVLELPYKGDSMAMLVVLPNRVDGLAEVEASLSAAKLEAWTSALTSQRVMVSLPRFEVSPPTAMSLGGELVKLGMIDAFERNKADFTGIANPADPRDRLFISKVFHKAFVKVDEKGTEAAAATAVVMARAGSAPAKAVEFNANHPFLFAIIDKTTNLVLFMGRVIDPTSK